MSSETERLYDSDPYLAKFDATIRELTDKGIVLDRTAFHPEGGGQAGDTGTVNGVKVLDTKLIDGKIVHLLEAPVVFKIGAKVKGIVDWERRYRIMKLHSAAHIMEFFLFKRFGNIDRLGSFVDDRKDRADYSYDGRLPSDELKLVEDETNIFLAEGQPIQIRLDPSRPSIRVWKCSWMEMPCGGTHVRSTREIGSIRLKRKNPGRGVERVETYLAEDST